MSFWHFLTYQHDIFLLNLQVISTISLEHLSKSLTFYHFPFSPGAPDHYRSRTVHLFSSLSCCSTLRVCEEPTSPGSLQASGAWGSSLGEGAVIFHLSRAMWARSVGISGLLPHVVIPWSYLLSTCTFSMLIWIWCLQDRRRVTCVYLNWMYPL